MVTTYRQSANDQIGDFLRFVGEDRQRVLDAMRPTRSHFRFGDIIKGEVALGSHIGGLRLDGQPNHLTVIVIRWGALGIETVLMPSPDAKLMLEEME